MISRERQCIFIHIPKTGGTSIEDIIWGPERENRTPDQLWKNLVRPGFNRYQSGGMQHLLATQVRAEVGDDLFNRCFRFAFVRNPWDRAVSQYVYMKQRRDLRRLIGMNRFSSFKTYLNRLKRGTHVQWMEQWRFILDDNGDMLVDFLGRYENFKTDVRKVLDRLAISCDTLPHEKQGRRGPYPQYYDDESRELVADMYARDIQLLGYRFEG